MADPWFGILVPVDLPDTGVSVGSMEMYWDRYETAQGVFDNGYLGEVLARYDELAAAGLRVVLDLGMQYPPNWVFNIPNSRFVNQDGDVWSGGAGDDVPNGPFNTAVSDAQITYIRQVADVFDGRPLFGVRAGGGGYGELRYPTGGDWWGFDEVAAASCPVPDWRPGDFDADVWLEWYLQTLADYGALLAGAARASFRTAVHVLLPSWGIRPGETDIAITNNLDGTTIGELRHTIQQGLDWPRQTAALEDVADVILSTTWLDAASQGNTDSLRAPIEYLASVASAPIMGENTGTGTKADMARSVAAVQNCDLVGMMWVRGSDFGQPGLADLTDYVSLISKLGVSKVGILDSAVLLLQAKNYSGAGDWLDESGNNIDFTPVNSPTFVSNGIDSHFVLNGTTQYFEAADNPLLDFAAADDFTVIVVFETGVSVWNQALYAKRVAGGASTGYYLIILGNDTLEFSVSDGALFDNDGSSAITLDAKTVGCGVRDQSVSDTVEAFVDGSSAAATTDNTAGTLANGEVSRIGRLSGAGTNYMNGKIYAVAIWASALSDADVAAAGNILTLAEPSNPAATATDIRTIVITWSDVTGETGYRIERSTDQITWTSLGVVAADVTLYTDTGLDRHTTYYYRVIAFDAEGESDPSTVVSAETLYVPLRSPTPHMRARYRRNAGRS